VLAEFSRLREKPSKMGFVSGHDFSRADKANQLGMGFSPCAMIRIKDRILP
jgi:hypothetical protein